jgi:hypothetical protein
VLTDQVDAAGSHEQRGLGIETGNVHGTEDGWIVHLS